MADNDPQISLNCAKKTKQKITPKNASICPNHANDSTPTLRPYVVLNVFDKAKDIQSNQRMRGNSKLTYLVNCPLMYGSVQIDVSF